MAASMDLVKTAFDDAVREFKKNLRDDKLYAEIIAIQSIDEVYDLTDKLQEEQRKKNGLRNLGKIERYLTRLRDYTGAIDTFVQVKPEVLGLIWGPIKLILQWSSVMTQSLDAVISTTAEIGNLLPEFKEISQMFPQNHLVKELLVLFFKDILDFYHIVLKFFSMSHWRIFFESMWPRKRDNINVVTKHIEDHKLLLRNEVRLEHIRDAHDLRIQSLENFKSIAKANQHQEFHTIKTDICPRFYDEKLNWYHGRVCKGTGRWLEREGAFTKWIDPADKSARFLWLQGIPGAGKTFLSGTVIDTLRQKGYSPLFAFLSHTSSGDTTAISVLHSLVFQLGFMSENLETVVCQSTREYLKSDTSVTVALLKKLLDCAGLTFIIIDGVDEIEEIERVTLLSRLLEVSADCAESRILISSRPEDDIASVIRGKGEELRVDMKNAGSIQTYVNKRNNDMCVQQAHSPDITAEIKSLLAPLAANSKGMFLYAKIILDMVDGMEDLDEIRNELTVLPEDLDAAYSRVLARVNNLHPKSRSEKARKLLGWIGCSPTPLTIHEIEQALTVKEGDYGNEAQPLSRPNIVKLCGPVVEIVDEYVQFVHFTVKEYLFSPRIDGGINLIDATLSLAICCLTYLCHDRYAIEESDDFQAISNDLILKGAYRFHFFATRFWFDLVESYMRLLKTETPPEELTSYLDDLEYARTNIQFRGLLDEHTLPISLSVFKNTHPDIYKLLGIVSSFRERCTGAEYHVTKQSEWRDLDPLTNSRYSLILYETLNDVICSKDHMQDCPCMQIDLLYGRSRYKCGILDCVYHRHGFPSKKARISHEKHHTRPWKCNISGCEFQNIGFVSQRMRDDHFSSGHRSQNPQAPLLPGTADADEILPLAFDAISSDDIELLKSLLPLIQTLGTGAKNSIASRAASQASVQIFNLLDSISPIEPTTTRMMINVILRNNIENFRILISRYKTSKHLVELLRYVLQYGSAEVCQIWKETFLREPCDATKWVYGDSWTWDRNITYSRRDAMKENVILSAWEHTGLFFHKIQAH